MANTVKVNRARHGYVNIDGEKVKEIIRKSGYTSAVFCRALNRSTGVISQACKDGRMNMDYIDKINAIFGVDLSPAIIPDGKTETGKEQAETEPAKEETGTGWLKVIEDYSYVRSNDSDRITAAIDRLAAVLQEINSKL